MANIVTSRTRRAPIPYPPGTKKFVLKPEVAATIPGGDKVFIITNHPEGVGFIQAQPGPPGSPIYVLAMSMFVEVPLPTR